jgi:molybdopterin converting factor small subunit
MAEVRLTLPLGWDHPRGLRELRCEAATVGEALDGFITQEPLLEPRIRRPDGRVWVGVFVNGRNVHGLDGLATRLADGDILTLLSPLQGG